MNDADDVEMRIRKALAYMRTAQQDNGSFPGYTSPTITPFTSQKEYHTTFTPAIILGALASVPGAADIRSRTAEWLITERGAGWSYNYWTTDAPERHTMPYPDDLDDTFCVLSALHQHDTSLIDAAALGEIVQILLAAESQVGGPYRTWLVTPDTAASWQDVDLAVNANIAFFLRLVAEPLPNLTAIMDQAIATNAYRSPYYPNALQVAYFIARAYTGGHAQDLATFIRNQQPHDALTIALQCSALARLGAYDGMDTRIEELQNLQQHDGSWPAGAFCLDAAVNDRPFYHGSPALTTALAIEALQTYVSRPTPSSHTRTSERPPGYQTIIAAARQPFTGLQNDLRTQCEHLVDLIAKGDHSHEIVMLPQLFAASLTPQPAIAPATLQQLSLANTYGWIAYTIYDDFLDEEGNPLLLPAANTCLRMSLDAFANAVPQNPVFQHYVRDTFNSIDSANTWEIAHCRQAVRGNRLHITKLPYYGKLDRLAERSLGHALTPLAVLILTGHTLHDDVAAAMRTSLQQYLIARQLQDDMLDWERDLRSGHMNAVVVAIARKLQLKPGDYDLNILVPRMRNAFWQHVLQAMCTRTLRHLSAARMAARQSGVVRPVSPLHTLYNQLEQRTHDTQSQQAEAAAFLQAYKNPPA